MPASLKDLIASDVDLVFFQLDDFAETHRVEGKEISIVIDNDQLAKIVHVAKEPSLGFRATTIRGLYKVDGGGAALERRLEEIFAEVDRAVADGVSFLVLSDRNSDADLAPIPSLLLLSAVHHHTLRRHLGDTLHLTTERLISGNRRC